ncbi:Uncharacterized protein dnm_043490 [Desulfonema magnum]|uniref:Uncharacterized protein n=1 Tax=Desulfonema magnum TaxID=45655 RepID=A0A975BML7_9BACT|nr:Uncharacterized protein dnm_043490 [Desulfonema magnum]
MSVISVYQVSADRKIFRLSQGGHGGQGRNPGFSGGGSAPSGKKAGFLCRTAHTSETF